jgi:endonuclease/exonuclease/phosphatase family metal-dependent hydrolase
MVRVREAQFLLEVFMKAVKPISAIVKRAWLPVLACAAAISWWSGCGKNAATDFSGTNPDVKSDSLVAVDSTKPLDTLLVATYNMSIGFPVSQLLFTNMTDPVVAYHALDTLYARYSRGVPSERLKAMAKAIKDLDLDIVGFQEVMTIGRDDVQINDFLPELLADIKAIGGPDYQSYRTALNDTVLAGAADGKAIKIKFHEGNALIAKPGFRILDSARIDYFSLFPIPVAGNHKSERCVAYLRLQSPKGIVWHVYTSHIEVFPDYGNSQVSQLRKVVADKGKGKDPQVILADFNSDPGTDGDQVMIEGGFLDTYSGPSDSGFTCCVAASELWNTKATFSDRRIDYIFVRRIAKVLETHTALVSPWPVNATDSVWASDHRMVWSRLVGQ